MHERNTFFYWRLQKPKVAMNFATALVRNSFAILVAVFYVYNIMAMCTLFYYVIPLKVLWRILTAFSTQWNSLSCHFCLVICCKQPMPFTFPVSVLAQFIHLLWFLALSKENTELTANIRHLNLSTSPHIISNQCHAAKNNFAIAMHVETNPYLWCIKEKVGKN